MSLPAFPFPALLLFGTQLPCGMVHFSGKVETGSLESVILFDQDRSDMKHAKGYLNQLIS